MMKAYNDLSSKDKDTFKKTTNLLLNNCFVNRATDLYEYSFIVRNIELLDNYFSAMGFKIILNESTKIAQLVNEDGKTKQKLKLGETIILLLLRVLYEEKRRDLTQLDDVMITVRDIHEKFNATKMKDTLIGKTALRNAIATFKGYNLLKVLDSDLTKDNSRIILYPSILMGASVGNIQDSYDRISEYEKGEPEDEDTQED